MILSYIFDLCDLIDKRDSNLPFIGELNLFKEGLSLDYIKQKRDEISQRHAQDNIEKHLFFVVINNSFDMLDLLKGCYEGMIKDVVYFGDHQSCELHVICNYVMPDGFDLPKYEQTMIDLAKKQTVSLYSWIIEEYDYSGNIKLSDIQKSHAILRLVDFLQTHRNDSSVSLLSYKSSVSSKVIVDSDGNQQKVTEGTDKLCYHLFGNSFLFIDESKEKEAMLACYKYKNLQHLLNLTDKDIESYIKDKLQSCIHDRKQLDDAIDGSSEDFLISKIISVPASKITVCTQDILLKDSDNDKEYLVDAKTNKLTFIEDIATGQKHGLDGTDGLLKEYSDLLHQENDPQDVISDRFIKDLKDKLIIHFRLNLNRLNNAITDKRNDIIGSYKKTIEKYLSAFLDKKDDSNYTRLNSELNDSNVSNHSSNLDYGLAFLDVLIGGNSPKYLKDTDVAVGDVNLTGLLDETVEYKREKQLMFDECIKDYRNKTITDDNGISYFKTKFNGTDTEINKQRNVILDCNCELERWVNETKGKIWHKLTAKSKSIILFAACLLVTGLSICIRHKVLDESSDNVKSAPAVTDVRQTNSLNVYNIELKRTDDNLYSLKASSNASRNSDVNYELSVVNKRDTVVMYNSRNGKFTKVEACKSGYLLRVVEKSDEIVRKSEYVNVTGFGNARSKGRWIPILIFIIGALISAIPIVKVLIIRKKAQEELERQKNIKRGVMREFVSLANGVAEARYNYILAYHSVKTLLELLNYSKQKRTTLFSFKKQLFKQCIKYRLDSETSNNKEREQDNNTIEITRDNPRDLLFSGGNDIRRFCFNYSNTDSDRISVFFDDYCRKVARYETSKLDIMPQPELDLDAIIDEQIEPINEDKATATYTELSKTALIPTDSSGFLMDDIRQGQCGDCYFMAALASIAQKQPSYLPSMITPVGENHDIFTVKFYSESGDRVTVGINNKFWTENEEPLYAKISKDLGDGFDIWVMAVEKAWAKVNGGYEKIEGSSSDGNERVRRVEYSYALTGKNAYYCMTKQVSDKKMLLETMKEHFNKRGLPISLYSASGFENMDPTIVENHAYALRAINEDNTFDIFNPWNSRKEGEKGQHYNNKSIDFIVDNFDVVVFFDISESDFNNLDMTLNINRIDSLLGDIDNLFNKCYMDEECSVPIVFDGVIDESHLQKFVSYSIPLFRRNRIIDESGTIKQCLLYGKPSGKISAYIDEKIGIGNYQFIPIPEDKNACSMYRFIYDFTVDEFRN